METIDNYIQNVLNNLGFNKSSIMDIDDSNIDKLNGISSKIVNSKKQYSLRDDFKNLKSDYIISLIETYYPVSIISFDCDHNISGLSHYAIVKKLPLDFIQVLFVTTSSILDDVSKLRIHDPLFTRKFNLRSHIALQTEQFVYYHDYSDNCYFHRTLIQISCKKGFFGDPNNSSAYFQILRKRSSENDQIDSIAQLYYEGVLLNEHRFTNNVDDGDTFKQNAYEVLKPYTTELDEYQPLQFKKELTLEYIDNFNKNISCIQSMRDI